MNLRAAWKALRGFETKASETGPLVSLHNLGNPVWTNQNSRAIAEEGYKKQVIASRSIDIIAEAVGSIPWQLFQGTDKNVAIEEHPLLDLIRRPNPIMGGAEFFTDLSSYLLIDGNEYVERVGPDNGPPMELWPLRPDRMRVIAGETGLPSGFVYTVGGKSKRWEADPVTAESSILHLRRFSPLDDWYGLSPLGKVMNAVDTRNEADRWNKSLLQNSARPSGALVYAPKAESSIQLSPEQREQVRKDMDERMSGPQNAGRPPVLEGDFTWLEMGLSPKDMDWLEAKNITGRDIAVAFGVPPMLVGIQGDQTFANYREARLALWEETIIPFARNLRDELNNWLVPLFGDNLKLSEDLNDIPALTLRRERKFEALQQTDFLTVNEKRKEMGFDELDDGDIILGPMTSGPLLGEGVERDLDPDDEDEARGQTALPKGGLTEKQADNLHLLAYGDTKKRKPQAPAA